MQTTKHITAFFSENMQKTSFTSKSKGKEHKTAHLCSAAIVLFLT